MSDLVCTICAAAASTPPCRLELGMSGFLSAEDAALCAFPATQGFTCIDHTVCTDCLLEAKNAGSKCQPIADLQPSQSRGYVQRHSLAHFDAATQTAGTWLCQRHKNHRRGGAGSASSKCLPCACFMFLPPARFDRNLSVQGTQCCGYKEGTKAEEEKEGREYSTSGQPADHRPRGERILWVASNCRTHMPQLLY